MLTLALWVVSTSALGAGSADFEQGLIDRAVAQVGGVVDPMPEGKPIDEVLVSSEDIMGATDPWPDFFNWFHWRSKEHIVRREVLLGPGDAWDSERVAEVERNLRRMVIFAVTRVVAVQRGVPGHVTLLVVTKDRWSLRINSEFNIVGNLVQYLRLRPAEMNFLGRNVQAALDVLFKLDTLDLGQYLLFPRLFGQKLRLAETASLVFNRQTNALEGTAGYMLVDRPFYSLDQSWAFSTYAQWNVRRQRVFRGASVWQLEYPGGSTTVPDVYDSRNVLGEASVTKRFGHRYLVDLTVGLMGYDIAAAAPPEVPVDQALWLKQNYLPRTESASGPIARLRFFESRFVKLKNIETLELSEDFQLGPLLQLGARWGLPFAFTSAAYLEGTASLRYRWLIGGDLLALNASVAARFVTGAEPQNRRYVFEAINYSPPFEGGRLVIRAIADLRQNDLNNTQVLLGGGNGLRGTAPEEFTGRDYVLGSIEYRSRSFELATIYTSVVLFYDVGSAFNDRPSLTHTTGFGLRIMLPQFNQEVLRINLGLVLGGEAPSFSRLVTSISEPQGLGPDLLNNPP